MIRVNAVHFNNEYFKTHGRDAFTAVPRNEGGLVPCREGWTGGLSALSQRTPSNLDGVKKQIDETLPNKPDDEEILGDVPLDRPVPRSQWPQPGTGGVKP